jgi:hypothetical protein
MTFYQNCKIFILLVDEIYLYAFKWDLTFCHSFWQPPPPHRPSRITSKPNTSNSSSIGGRKPKYVTHHEHGKVILWCLVAVFSVSFLYTLTELISPIQCRASAPQWHWRNGEQSRQYIACGVWWIWEIPCCCHYTSSKAPVAQFVSVVTCISTISPFSSLPSNSKSIA